MAGWTHTQHQVSNTHDKLWMDQYLDHGCGWSVTSFDSSPSFSGRVSSSESSLQYQRTPVYTCTACQLMHACMHARTHTHTHTHTHSHMQINTINSPLGNFFDNNWTSLQLLSNERVPLPCEYEEQDYEHLTMCCHGNCTLQHAHFDNTTSTHWPHPSLRQLNGQMLHRKNFIYRHCVL